MSERSAALAMEVLVKIRFGYELVYSVLQPTPMILTLHSQM